jgi:hypothetical protein
MLRIGSLFSVYATPPCSDIERRGKAAQFSIKRKVIEIHFQEGMGRPHSGFETSIKPT